MGPLRVVLVHNRYQQAGGEDDVFEAEGRLLESHGHVVGRFTVDNRDLEGRNRLRTAARTIWNRDVYLQLRSLCRKFRPDVVHFHNTFPIVSPAGYYAARAEGAAVVQTLHNFRLVCPNALCFRGGRTCEKCITRTVRWPGIVHRCYRNSRSATAVTAAMLSVHSLARTWQARVDAYVALSEFARARFVTGGIPASRVVVKPNFLDPDPGVGLHRGEYALFVGRLSPEKGVAVLLQAWARLERRMALKVVGTGSFSPLPDCGQAAVEWLGRASPRRVLELMKEARFLLFPSEVYENCPMTLIQAFATGLPVVASGHGSIGEMVRDRESGRHFQPGDPVDLARTIAALIDRPETLEAMMRQSRQAYEARYTADRNYDRLRQVYDVAFEHARAAA